MISDLKIFTAILDTDIQIYVMEVVVNIALNMILNSINFPL